MPTSADDLKDCFERQQAASEAIRDETAAVSRLLNEDLAAVMRWRQLQATADAAFTEMIKNRTELTHHLALLQQARVMFVAATGSIQAIAARRTAQA